MSDKVTLDNNCGHIERYNTVCVNCGDEDRLVDFNTAINDYLGVLTTLNGRVIPPRPVDAIVPQRQDAIALEACVSCPATHVTFRDRESVTEYKITGMCQECQDEFYANE